MKSNKTLIALLMIIIISTPLASALLTDGIRAYYSFDNGDARDDFGALFNATLVNGATSLGSGVLGSGMDITSSRYINLNAGWQDFIPVTDEFSFSIWVNYASQSGDNYILGSRYTSTPNEQIGFSCYNNDCNYVLYDRHITSSIGSGLTQSFVGAWHHVVVTYDSVTGGKAYIDGVERANSSVGGLIISDFRGNVDIGARGTFNDRSMNGYVDEVGIWDRPLNTTEISELYNSGTGYNPLASIPVNTAPTIDSKSPISETLNSSIADGINLSIVASDPQNDSLTYQWYKDGSLVSGENNTSYYYREFGKRNYNITVSVSDYGFQVNTSWNVSFYEPPNLIYVNSSRIYNTSLIPNPVGSSGNLLWEGISLSDDGEHIIAGYYNPPNPSRLMLSNNSGATFTETRPKGDVDGDYVFSDMSTDGKYVVVNDFSQKTYLSSNYGYNWTETALVDGTYRVKISDDGNTILAIRLSDGKASKSIDAGVSFTNYTNIISGNIDIFDPVKTNSDLQYSITASFTTNPSISNLYFSNDFGESYSIISPPLTAPSSQYYSYDISENGQKIVLSDYSSFLKSDDAGTTWNRTEIIKNYNTLSHTAITSDGNTRALFFGEGLFFTNDDVNYGKIDIPELTLDDYTYPVILSGDFSTIVFARVGTKLLYVSKLFENVNINSAPTIDSILPISTSPSINDGENQTFNITASDSNNDTLSFEWYVNGTPQSNNSTGFIANSFSVGVYNVSIVVTDGLLTDSQMWNLTVLAVPNVAPTIDSTSPAQNVALDVGSNQLFSITKSDANNDTLFVAWYVNDTEQIGETSDIFSYTGLESQVGSTINVTVYVTDGAEVVSYDWFVTLTGYQSQYEANDITGMTIDTIGGIGVTWVQLAGLIAVLLLFFFATRWYMNGKLFK